MQLSVHSIGFLILFVVGAYLIPILVRKLAAQNKANNPSEAFVGVSPAVGTDPARNEDAQTPTRWSSYYKNMIEAAPVIGMALPVIAWILFGIGIFLVVSTCSELVHTVVETLATPEQRNPKLLEILKDVPLVSIVLLLLSGYALFRITRPRVDPHVVEIGRGACQFDVRPRGQQGDRGIGMMRANCRRRSHRLDEITQRAELDDEDARPVEQRTSL